MILITITKRGVSEKNDPHTLPTTWYVKAHGTQCTANEIVGVVVILQHG